MTFVAPMLNHMLTISYSVRLTRGLGKIRGGF